MAFTITSAARQRFRRFNHGIFDDVCAFCRERVLCGEPKINPYVVGLPPQPRVSAITVDYKSANASGIKVNSDAVAGLVN